MKARRKQGGTYSAEQLSYIRDRAGKDTDEAIGEHLGFHPRKVAYIRHDNQIKGRTPGVNRRSEVYLAKLAYVKAHYVDLGQSATEVAKALGADPKTIRKIAFRQGWTRRREFRNINQALGQARRWEEARAAEAAKPKTIIVPPTDAELIAAALKAGKLTILPPGQACGLTAWEANLGTYKPSPVYGWGRPRTAQEADDQRRRAGHRGRKAAELKRTPVRLEAAE